MLRPLLLAAALTACSGGVIGAETDDDTDPVDTDPVDTGDPNGGVDRDSDGWTADVDCNDLDPRVNPGADEVPWNNVDDDCDGRIDADGTFRGMANVDFRATIEGVAYRWDLDCPAQVTRSTWRITLSIVCDVPDEPRARQAMGAQLSIVESDNAAVEASFAGAVTTRSSDGWSVEGDGRLTWSGSAFESVGGTAAMRSRFARMDAAFSLALDR